MPFGALQVACVRPDYSLLPPRISLNLFLSCLQIFFACLVATRFRIKSVVFICLALPVIAVSTSPPKSPKT